MGFGFRVRGWFWDISLTVAALLWAGPLGQAATTQPARTFDRAAVIPIRGEINEVTLDSVQRRLQRVRAERIPLVLFEMHTPGGALGPTLDICREIKSLRDSGVRVYAWIHHEAYSAGTIIALATDGIVMASNATIGDCQPITMTSDGAQAIPEGLEAKALSPLLAELRDSARRNGYDMDLVLALIRPDSQVYWLVNRKTQERRFVDAATKDQLLGGSPAEVSTLPSSDTGSAGGSGTAGINPAARSADARSADSRSPDARSNRGGRSEWEYVQEVPELGHISQPVKDKRELLTLRTTEATVFGWSLATLDSQGDLRRHFGVTGPIVDMESTWWEAVVTWLASPLVRGILFILIVLGAYAEFHAPGLNLAGGVALVSLVLYLGAPYLAGFTVTWEIVAVLLGLVLLGLELFVIPGFGVAGIAGLLLVGIGFISSYIPQEPGFTGPHWPQLQGTYTYLKHGLWSVAGGSGISLLGMAVLARILPKIPIAGRLVLQNPTREQVIPEDPFASIARLGNIGVAQGPLRPAGKARFGATVLDVVTEGDYIGPGVRVEIVSRDGGRVVVRRVD